MNRKLKAMGVTLFAAFAFSAIGAQAASADLFVSEVKDTVLTSAGSDSQHVEHVFTYKGNEVKCKVANFSATAPGTEETELTVTPTYDECTFGGAPATVRTNHCDYTFTAHTVEHNEEPTQVHAPVDIGCGEGEHIEVEVPSFGHCLLTIAPQTTTKGVTYTDGKQEGSEKEEVTVNITAEVEVTRDNPESNFFCSLIAASGTGEYHGASWIKGYKYNAGPEKTFTEDATAATAERGTTHWYWGETHEVEEKVTYTHGAQVNIGADTAE